MVITYAQQRWGCNKQPHENHNEISSQTVAEKLEEAREARVNYPVNYSWKLRQCEHCGGDIHRSYNHVFDIEECLQCGAENILFGSETTVLYALGHYPEHGRFLL